MRKFYVFLMILLGGIAFSQEKNQYFDQNWKPATKDKAKFYRPLPLKKFGTLELVRDYYYATKSLQMQAYILNSDDYNYAGEVYWYNEDGRRYDYKNYLNKTAQKKLSYYFDDGKLWKTAEYGDSLKNGKTTEYKPDGSILGEAIYKDGNLISGTIGERFDTSSYNRYNPKTKQAEYVSIPQYVPEDYTQIFYYKNSLKDAVISKNRKGKLYEETLYAEDGSIIQKLDSLSYYQGKDELKNGRDYHYSPIRSAITNLDSYTEYQSFPFSEVKFRNLAYILLYRGEIHFIEKNPTKNLFRETDYEIFEDRGQKFVRLEWESGEREHWKELKEFQDPETQLIAVADISSLNKNDLFEKVKRKTLMNPELLKKGIREEITFTSPEKSVKTLSYSGKAETENDSQLIWAEIKPGVYIMIRDLGGYFIPQKFSEILFIPNFTTK